MDGNLAGEGQGAGQESQTVELCHKIQNSKQKILSLKTKPPTVIDLNPIRNVHDRIFNDLI